MQKRWKLLALGVLFGTLLALVAQSNISAATPVTDVNQVSGQKVIAPTGVLNANQEGVTLWHDYGAFALYKVTDAALTTLPASTRQQVTVATDMDRILLDAYPFDTQREALVVPDGLGYTNLTGSSLQLVQFVGPIKQEWLSELKAVGAVPVHYIANNGYLVWTDAHGRDELAKMASQKEFLQFSTPYQPFFKFGPTLRNQTMQGDELVTVTVQMYRHDGREATEAVLKDIFVEQLSAWEPVLDYQNAVATVRVSDLALIAQQTDVYWVGERLERERMDEVQGQILAGNFNGDQSGPSGTGYIDWLTSYGFSQTSSDYPIVDVVDDGIGTGSVNSGDYTMHQAGSLANPTRLAYVANCTAEANGGSTDGHGHINTNIVGGYDPNEGAGFPFEDPNGYLRGMGINPFGQMAGTRIFGGGGFFDISACGGTDTGVIQSSQDNGSKISTNSWGCSGCAGSYDDSSQAYDVGTRDADLTEAGNQELMFLFAAGNSGSGGGTVGTPGNGKNMLTVGASENQRPTDEDGNWTDGCNVDPTGADNAMDVIGFSSRGPAPGGRVKPEVIAPGTHIQGTASTNGAYNGSGVCDQFRPSGQTVFAASSGTSHSTPAVAGVTSLVYYWLQNEQPVAGAGGGYEPSPAVLKAYVMNHPTYLTGVSANDTLPSNVQGYGMPNMGTMFDNTPKYILDQSVLFDNSGETWTWAGVVADPSKPVRIMMVYTDKAGAIGTSPQVNDLNLSAMFGLDTYLGNEFSGEWSVMGGTADTLNNYEGIFLPAGTSGVVEITVTAFNIADDGVPNVGDGTDQDFALVCYNCAQSADFSLAVSPPSINLCTPDDAVYGVDVGSILGYSASVSLSASGNPAGTTATFGTASAAIPYTTTLTIGNTGAASFGSYDISVTGMGPTSTYTSTVGLDLYTAVPTAPALTLPADNAVDQSLQPAFSWDAADQSQGYFLEVATDMGFTNVVYSATVSGTSHAMSGASLDPDTEYYWRVNANNICGDGAYSATSSFTTVLLFCSFPNLGILDNTTVSDSLTIERDEYLSDLNVSMIVNHTFVGDLAISLVNEDSGTTVELLPASFSCSNDNIDATFDDEAANPISCGGSAPTVSGEVQPAGSLATLDFLSLAGDWRLDVTDSAGGDTGTLVEWCLQPQFTANIGTLSGMVTDFNSGDPLVGLSVAITDGVVDYAAVTDVSGMYTRDLAPGTYTVTAASPNYETVTVGNVVISDDVITTQDFSLQAGQLLSSDDSFAATVVFSDSTTAVWNLTNTGTMPVEFQIRAAQTGYSPETASPSAGEDFLIINDGGFNTNPVGAMEIALSNLGYTYATITSADFVSADMADLLTYQAVLYAGTISSGGENDKAIAFLDAGGNLLAADNDLAYFGSTALLNDYLQIFYSTDSGSTGVVNGVDIMSGISTDISSDPYPDDVTLNTEAVGIFEAPSGDWAGTRVERNGYKAVYLGWEFHYADGSAVGDPVETDIMEAALGWLTGSGPIWLSTDVVTGTLGAGISNTVTITMDSSLVDLPGTYYGALTVQNDTPYGDLVVPVTMTTSCPTCGNISGDITDVQTNAPLSATVQITTTGGYDQSLSGTSYDINLLADTYYLTASAPDYATATAVVTLTTGASEVIDFALLRQYAELSYSPAEIEEDMQVGDVVTNTVTITNSGTIPLDFSVTIDNFNNPAVLLVPQSVTPLTSAAVNTASEREAIPGGAEELASAQKADATASSEASPLSNFRWAVSSSVIYDNGPLVNCVGCGAGGADESVLQSVSLGMDTLGAGHQFLNNNRIADDFEVTGLGWKIDTMTFFAYQTGSSTTSSITAVNVRIWDGPPNDPASNIVFGDDSTNRMISTGWSNIYRTTETTVGATNRPIMASVVDMEGITLAPGTYWVDWQTDGSLASGPWAPVITINGETITGNALQSVAGTWGPLQDGGTLTPQGFPFIIEGTAYGNWVDTTTGGGTIAPNSTATFDVVFDATNVAQVGTYTADLIFDGNFENSVPTMPLTMNITCPTCGTLSGTVTDSFTGDPVAATLYITSTGGFAGAVKTDGSYTLDLLPDTYYMTASAPGYLPQTETVVIITGASETADFVLTYLTARVDATPAAIDVSVIVGDVLTDGLDIQNTGAVTTPYTVDVTAPWLTVDPTSGSLGVGETASLTTVFDTSTFTQTGVFTTMLALNSDDDFSPLMVPVTLTVVAPDSSIELDVTVSMSNECGTAESMIVPMGSTVYYCYTVMNTGDAMLPNHTITDSVFGHVDTFIYDLMPGASESVVYSQTVSADAVSMAMWEASHMDFAITSVATDTVSVLVETYGVELSDAAALSGEAGTMVTYTVDITNTGNVTDTFTVALSGNSWGSTASTTEVTLGAGEMGSMTVMVEIPDTAVANDTDAVTVTATSQTEATATASTTLTTTATEAPVTEFNLYLPLISRP